MSATSAPTWRRWWVTFGLICLAVVGLSFGLSSFAPATASGVPSLVIPYASPSDSLPAASFSPDPSGTSGSTPAPSSSVSVSPSTSDWAPEMTDFLVAVGVAVMWSAAMLTVLGVRAVMGA